MIRFVWPTLMVMCLLSFGGFGSSSLIAGEVVKGSGPARGRPWLGIAIDKGAKGVLVKGVMPDTPAEQAGFKVGDEVLSIEGASVREPKRLIELVSAAGIGTEVTVVLLRDGNQLTKKLKLVMRPDELKIVRDKLVGKPMPSFKLPVIGRKESLDSKTLRGRVVVIEFWATWCPACRASHGRLSQFAATHKDVSVLAISDEDAATLDSYVKELKPQFMVLQDISQKTPAEYMASAIPMLVVVNKKGDITFVNVGAGPELEDALNAAISVL